MSEPRPRHLVLPHPTYSLQVCRLQVLELQKTITVSLKKTPAWYSSSSTGIGYRTPPYLLVVYTRYLVTKRHKPVLRADNFNHSHVLNAERLNAITMGVVLPTAAIFIYIPGTLVCGTYVTLSFYPTGIYIYDTTTYE